MAECLCHKEVSIHWKKHTLSRKLLFLLLESATSSAISQDKNGDLELLTQVQKEPDVSEMQESKQNELKGDFSTFYCSSVYHFFAFKNRSAVCN